MAGALEQLSAIDLFLKENEEKECLRFTTAGSVDDGKSTLIGRLLYDSKGVYEDQLASVRKSPVNRSGRDIDLSLLTDGLRAEREQGITIDVAYRYFSTPSRKFIISDTPGHEQYTRNMATGASTADLAVVLVDARNGVLPQSRRHSYIASLLAIPHVAVAVNKMDLVGFSQDVFEAIRQELSAFLARLRIDNVQFIPLSALDGDNVVTRSPRTPWYEGPSLLEHLETVPVRPPRSFDQMRFPVQYVIRPHLDFRGYAGQLASGIVRPGDRVMALPSGRTSKVKSVVTFDGELGEAFSPLSVTICLEDEIDISRGDMLVHPSSMPHVSRRFDAMVVWMSEQPLELNQPYLLKHTTQQAAAVITGIAHKVDVNSMAHIPTDRLQLNEIAQVSVEVQRPLFFDAYDRNRITGSFILIDPLTNLTLGAGMIRERTDDAGRRRARQALLGIQLEAARPTPAERAARLGHQSAAVWLTARTEVAQLVERRLFDRGCMVHLLTDDVGSELLPEVASIVVSSGLIAVCSSASAAAEDLERAEALIGADRLVVIEPESLPANDQQAADAVCRILANRGVFQGGPFGYGEGI
ncbi:MAG: sulfate adenylyltransferase subunit CysN [Acidobacteria bacterium]|nr:sulfate adenylyltransferase subunit CysN [Acidobacteriota bacterium]